MWTLGNMRSIIKEADPKNWGFPQTPQNGGFRMLLQVMKMSQSVQLPAATTFSSLCVTHVMQPQPGIGVSYCVVSWRDVWGASSKTFDIHEADVSAKCYMQLY